MKTILLVSLVCIMSFSVFLSFSIKLVYAELGYTGNSYVVDESSYNYGLTEDGTYFYITDWLYDKIYRYYMNGTYLDSFSLVAANDKALGLTTNGTYLWVTDESDEYVYRYWANNGTYIDNFSVSQTDQPHGICNDNTYFWIGDTSTDTVYKYWMNGTYIETFDVSGESLDDPQYVTVDDTYLWVLEVDDDTVYRYNKSGTYLDNFVITDRNAANDFSLGIINNGTYIWLLDWSDKTIYEYYQTNQSPTIGDFAISDSHDNVGDYLVLNSTISDVDGITELVNATVELTNGIILKYDNATDTFSESQDTNNYCTLGTCSSTSINFTTILLSWNFSLSYADEYSIIADNTKVYDSNDNSGSGSSSNLFIADGLNVTGLTNPTFLGDGSWSYEVQLQYAYNGSGIDSGIIYIESSNGTTISQSLTTNSTGWATLTLNQVNGSRTGTYTLYGHNETNYGITDMYANETFKLIYFTGSVYDTGASLVARTGYAFDIDSDGTDVYETATATDNSINYSGDQIYSSSDYYTPPVFLPSGLNYSVTITTGSNHILRTYTSTTAWTSAKAINFYTSFHKIDTSDSYAYVSLNNTYAVPWEGWMNATLTVSGNNIVIEAENLTTTAEILFDVANWLKADQPHQFEVDTSQYNQGDETWSWNENLDVFTFTYPFSGSHDISLSWMEDTSGSGGSVPYTGPEEGGEIPESEEPESGEETEPEKSEGLELSQRDLGLVGLVLIIASITVVGATKKKKTTRKKTKNADWNKNKKKTKSPDWRK